jgi:hypothetical protein
VYDELQREAAAYREEKGGGQEARAPLSPSANVSTVKLRSAAQRKATRFITYAGKLAATLERVARGPLRGGGGGVLQEIALLFGTTAVAPREVYRLKFGDARGGAAVSSAAPASTAGEVPEEGAASERGINMTIRRLLRSLYAADPSRLHQSVVLGPQRVHVLACVVAAGGSPATAAGAAPLCDDEAWTFSPCIDLDAVCTRARVTTIDFGGAQAPLQATAAETAACDRNSADDSVEAAVAALDALDLHRGEEELWFSLASLERAVKPPSQRGKGSGDGIGYM